MTKQRRIINGIVEKYLPSRTPVKGQEDIAPSTYALTRSGATTRDEYLTRSRSHLMISQAR